MTQTPSCPICGKPSTDAAKSPFCTERCRKIDFFRWWDGRYAISSSIDMESYLEGEDSPYSPDDDSSLTDTSS